MLMTQFKVCTLAKDSSSSSVLSVCKRSWFSSSRSLRASRSAFNCQHTFNILNYPQNTQISEINIYIRKLNVSNISWLNAHITVMLQHTEIKSHKTRQLITQFTFDVLVIYFAIRINIQYTHLTMTLKETCTYVDIILTWLMNYLFK